MVKKYRNLFILTLVALFMSVCSVSAKTLTPTEIGNEALKYEPKANYVFVIGNFAYTSKYEINIQDIMFAVSRSYNIDSYTASNIKDAVKTMTIYRIDRTYDANLNPTGWELATSNEIGNGAPFAEIDIRYIDYNEIINFVDANAVIDQALETINNNSFDLTKESDGSLTFNVLDRTTTLENIHGSGVIDALVEAFDENEGIGTFNIVYGEDYEHSLYLYRDMTDDYALEQLKTFVKAVSGKEDYADVTLADLVGEFTVTMYLNGESSEFTDGTLGSKEFTVNVKQTEVNTETLIDNYIEPNNELYGVAHNGANLNVTVKDSTVSIEEGMGSGVIAGLLEMVQEDGIQEIDFTYTTGNVTLQLTKDSTDESLITWFHNNALAIFGKTDNITNADLQGKSFTFKVVVDESKAASASTNPAEYTVTFAE